MGADSRCWCARALDASLIGASTTLAVAGCGGSHGYDQSATYVAGVAATGALWRMQQVVLTQRRQLLGLVCEPGMPTCLALLHTPLKWAADLAFSRQAESSSPSPSANRGSYRWDSFSYPQIRTIGFLVPSGHRRESDEDHLFQEEEWQ